MNRSTARVARATAVSRTNAVARTASDDTADDRRRFLDAVVEGLSQPRKRLPTKYLYDDRGSALFDAICELPEYYLTRTELAIMRAHLGEIAAALGPDVTLVEYGSGSSIKTRMLLDALDRPAVYVPIDISAAHLERTALGLRAAYPGLVVTPVAADFTGAFDFVAPAEGRVGYFPGSTIGNFEPDAATALLRSLAQHVGPRGKVLLGFDLRKSASILEPAYDDAAGVTAAFNLNLLVRIARELDAEVDASRFRHRAFFDQEHGRIVMTLVSTCDQILRVGDRRFAVCAGEAIVTEYSHKYTLDGFAAMARPAGLVVRRVWTDAERAFAVALLEPTLR